MANLTGWWKELTDERKKKPEYQADSFAIDIAMKISKRIEEISINKMEMAKKLGVSKSYVSQILQGNNNMTILTMCKIAQALNMKPIIDFQENDYVQDIAVSFLDSFKKKTQQDPPISANDAILKREVVGYSIPSAAAPAYNYGGR